MLIPIPRDRMVVGSIQKVGCTHAGESSGEALNMLVNAGLLMVMQRSVQIGQYDDHISNLPDFGTVEELESSRSGPARMHLEGAAVSPINFSSKSHIL